MGSSTQVGAVNWAASVQPGTPVRWKSLELAAWHRHRSVLAAMEPGRHRAPGFWLVPAAMLIALAAPLVGFALLLAGGSRSGYSARDRADVIPEAGVCFLVADLLLVSIVARALARPSEAKGSRGMGLYALAMGLVAALTSYLAADKVGMGQLWLVPMVLAAVAGLVLVVIGGGTSRPTDRTARRAAQEHAASGRRRAVLTAVAGVPPAGRESVEAELRQAVGDLVDRGVIDAAEAGRALDAPLGDLSHHMAQRGG